MIGDPISTFEGVAPGDVLLVSRQLRDKRTGEPFWWKSFRCVIEPNRRRHWMAMLLTLKMYPDVKKDVWEVDLRDEATVVQFVDPADWPPGVLAMRMKALATGLIKLD